MSADHLTVLRGLAANANVIETGAGCSTIAFLLGEARYVMSVAPDIKLFHRIKNYCLEKNIDTSAWHPVDGYSEVVLPKLMESKNTFDVAFIDGGHGMPTVFVDFVYMHSRLKPGGVIVIDDIQLHSAKELAKLLKYEPGFSMIQQINKIVLFKKIWDREFIGDFGNQKYVIQKTEEYEKSNNKYEI